MRSAEDPRISELRGKLRQAAVHGRESAQALELGQAETPVTGLFEALERDLNAPPLVVALVCLGAEARAAALGWLCGRDHRVFTVHLPDRAGLVELQLLDRSYVLETPDGRREEFGDPAALLEAVRRRESPLAADPATWVDPLRVQLPAGSGHEGLTVLVVDGIAELRDRPGLLAYLLSRTNTLAVAAPAHWQSPDGQAEALGEAVAAFPVFLPIVTVNGIGLPSSWWVPIGQRAEIALPPLVVGGEGGASTPDGAPERLSELRLPLALAGLARRTRGACEMVTDRQDTLLRQAIARQKRESRREAGGDMGGMDTEIRTATDRVKAQIGDDIGKLNTAIRESSRRAVLKNAALRESAMVRIQGLAAQDLVREPGVRSIRLSVHQTFVAEVMRELRKGVRRQLDTDLVLLRDGLGELRKNAEDTLRGTLPVAASLPINPPDDRVAWAAMKELLEVDIRYRGEIPKRGFMERLGEGRRLVFAALMIVSLGGSFLGFSNIRGMAWVGLLFLLMFIGSVVYTYRSWSRQDEESLTKELDKVRDALAAEVGRVLAEVEREKLAKLGAQLDELRKAALQAVEQALRDAQSRRAQMVEQQRREARSVLRNIETRVRDLQSLGQQVNRLVASATEADALARQLLRELARTPSAGSSVGQPAARVP